MPTPFHTATSAREPSGISASMESASVRNRCLRPNHAPGAQSQFYAPPFQLLVWFLAKTKLGTFGRRNVVAHEEHTMIMNLSPDKLPCKAQATGRIRGVTKLRDTHLHIRFRHPRFV